MSHFPWALARVDETCAPEELGSPRAIQELMDSLLTLRGKNGKGVFGLSPGSLILEDGEREKLEGRIRAALVANRDAFEKAGDAASLLELKKVAELCDLPELQPQRRFALRCDPLGDASSLDAKWNGLLGRLHHAKKEALPLRWSRVAQVFSEGPPEKVEFKTPNPDALYEFALRFEQSSGRHFSRELAATWSIADGIILDEMWWYLAPVKEWSWEDDGLRIGCGHYMQGSLCIESTEEIQNLADAPVVDRDDDGVEAYRYENLAALLDLLLPDGTESASSDLAAPPLNGTVDGVRKRPWWKFWA